MDAALGQNIKAIKMIMNKIKDNVKFKNQVLSLQSDGGYDAMQYALLSSKKKRAKTAKALMEFYDEDDLEAIFLPAVQLGDIKLLQNIWKKTKGDKQYQKKLLSIEDARKSNAFFLVCKNGSFKTLEWLLSLNDDEKDGDKEDEQNLLQTHPRSKITPLLLCVTKSRSRLTEEQNENYHRCVQLIFSKVSNKRSLIFDTTESGQDALMISCQCGDLPTTNFLLSQINDRDKKQLIGLKDKNEYTHLNTPFGGKLKLLNYLQIIQKYGGGIDPRHYIALKQALRQEI